MRLLKDKDAVRQDAGGSLVGTDADFAARMLRELIEWVANAGSRQVRCLSFVDGRGHFWGSLLRDGGCNDDADAEILKMPKKGITGHDEWVIGHGAGCAGAIAGKAPAASAYGGYPETPECRLPARNRKSASRSSQVQAVSGQRSGRDLPGIRSRGWIGLISAPQLPVLQKCASSSAVGHAGMRRSQGSFNAQRRRTSRHTKCNRDSGNLAATVKYPRNSHRLCDLHAIRIYSDFEQSAGRFG